MRGRRPHRAVPAAAVCGVRGVHDARTARRACEQRACQVQRVQLLCGRDDMHEATVPTAGRHRRRRNGRRCRCSGSWVHQFAVQLSGTLCAGVRPQRADVPVGMRGQVCGPGGDGCGVWGVHAAAGGAARVCGRRVPGQWAVRTGATGVPVGDAAAVRAACVW